MLVSVFDVEITSQKHTLQNDFRGRYFEPVIRRLSYVRLPLSALSERLQAFGILDSLHN